jgi:hypothetical protein
MFILDGKPLALDTPFIHNGIRYPSNWLRLTSLEEKEAIGITEVPDPEPYDQRFYWNLGIPKQLEDKEVESENGSTYIQKGLKTQYIQQIKQTANTLLTSTDWYLIRKLERNIDIPTNVISYRESVISFAQQTEELISSVKTVEELKEVLESQSNWPSLQN